MPAAKKNIHVLNDLKEDPLILFDQQNVHSTEESRDVFSHVDGIFHGIVERLLDSVPDALAKPRPAERYTPALLTTQTWPRLH